MSHRWAAITRRRMLLTNGKRVTAAAAAAAGGATAMAPPPRRRHCPQGSKPTCRSGQAMAEGTATKEERRPGWGRRGRHCMHGPRPTTFAWHRASMPSSMPSHRAAGAPSAARSLRRRLDSPPLHSRPPRTPRHCHLWGATVAAACPTMGQPTPRRPTRRDDLTAAATREGRNHRRHTSSVRRGRSHCSSSSSSSSSHHRLEAQGRALTHPPATAPTVAPPQAERGSPPRALMRLLRPMQLIWLRLMRLMQMCLLRLIRLRPPACGKRGR